MPKIPQRRPTSSVSARVRAQGSAKAAAAARRFVKTGPGEYNERAQFIGLRAADMHRLAKENRHLSLAEVRKLLLAPYFEERAVGLLILGRKFPKATPAEQRRIFTFYLQHTARIDSWGLVDCSAPHIVGAYLHTQRDRRVLDRLARSKSLWERRIAIVATQYLIRKGQMADTLRIAKALLKDEEDLIHKASGWMLREVGKRDLGALLGFLDEHAAVMPRTALRYAIERLPKRQRLDFMSKKRRAAQSDGA